MQSHSEYRINLCTFMGRKDNVKILLSYVERALSIDAIDHYWMIDMTRCVSDHEYIFSEQQRLDAMYPGRVHVVNHDVRKQELQAGTAKDSIGSWAPFYSFCDTFKDDDIIIKCDDDTLYFDVETIRAAAEMRWNNKHPLLMHANTINNGVCAYHQYNKNIWKFKDVDLLKHYPTSGLTGPLFSHPEIACACHDQFADDMLASEDNIEKYKLGNNPYFTARVSINFIFMLGSDRNILSKVDTQDEYMTSSKIGQQLDRPNMIIGDFVAAHHTYGVQEPVMEALGTYEKYHRLNNRIKSNRTTYTNKHITQNLNRTVTLKCRGIHAARYWSTNNSVQIKNKRTDNYINIDWFKNERMKVVKQPDGDISRHGTGVFWHKTEMSASDEPLLFNMDLTRPGVMQIQECTEIMKSSQPGNTNERFMSFPVKYWFQQNYKKQLIKPVHVSENEYRFESVDHAGFYLECDDRNPDKVFYFFKHNSTETWLVEDLSHTNNMLVPIELFRGDQHECENDPTIAVVTNDKKLPKCKNFREFYWMVTEYIWELIPVDDHVLVRLIADDKPDMFLTVKGNNVALGGKDKWIAVNGKLKHLNTGKFLNINSKGITLTKTGHKVIGG